MLQQHFINTEKKDFIIFLIMNSFLFSNIVCIWSFWFLKYVFYYNVNWSLAFEINLFLTIAIAFLFNFFPNSLISVHNSWNSIKNSKILIYLYSLYLHHPKTMYFLLSGLVFSYCRLELINLPDSWSFVGVLISLLALVRISIVSSLILFQIFITNKVLEKIWVSNSLVKKKFFHSSIISYGPFNSPQTPETAAKKLPAVVGTLFGVGAADVLQ